MLFYDQGCRVYEIDSFKIVLSVTLGDNLQLEVNGFFELCYLSLTT